MSLFTVEWHSDGRPIIGGLRFSDTNAAYIRFVCPHCSTAIRHDIAMDNTEGELIEATTYCKCWPNGHWLRVR